MSAPRINDAARAVLSAVALAGAASLPQQAAAQSFPSRPVTFIASNPPGASDAALRSITERLSKKWGQPVLIDYRPGAQGIPAVQTLLRAAPDGHTVLPVNSSHIVAHVLYKMPYEPNVLLPITQLGYVPQVLAVSMASGIRTFPELIAYSKANPGKLNWGTLGTAIELVLAGLTRQTGLTFTKIPYKGQNDANLAVVTGQVDAIFVPPAGAMPFYKDGRVRVVGATTPTRLKDMPEVPAIAEFVPNWEYVGFIGMAAPIKTPRAVIDIWNRDYRDVVSQPEVAKLYEILGYIIKTTSVEEFGDIMRREYETFSRLAQMMGVTRQDP